MSQSNPLTDMVKAEFWAHIFAINTTQTVPTQTCAIAAALFLIHLFKRSAHKAASSAHAPVDTFVWGGETAFNNALCINWQGAWLKMITSSSSTAQTRQSSFRRRCRMDHLKIHLPGVVSRKTPTL